jgi:N-acetylmuramoyl-L-alanine amidase/putative methionine-R-sulfoxide reductase with GAF domain
VLWRLSAMIRHTGTHDPKSRLRSRASAAPASTPRLPDLQAFLATAYLLEKSRQPLSTEVDTAGSAQLFSSLVSLQRQSADLEFDIDEILASVANHARTLTRADAAAVALLQDNHVVCRARAGPMAPTLGTSINLHSSFTGQSFRTREVLYCADTEDDPRVNRTACRVADIRSILVVPVERQRQSIGIVEVFSASPARFGTTEIRALELLAGLLADAVRVRDVVDPPATPEPVAAACDVAPPIVTTLAPQEISEDVAVTSELAKSEQELVVVRRPRSRSLFRPWLVISTLLLICVTGMFVGHQRGSLRSPALAPRSVVAAEPAPTITVTASPLPQTAATGPGILQGVKYNSQPDFTSIAIELSGPVKVKAEQLANPDRIYFDLAETRIAPEVIDALHTKTIPVGDRLVNRLRVAQKSKAVARVVIDLNRACEYIYLISEMPPFRLVVELHAPAKATGAQSMASATTAPTVALPAIAPGQRWIPAPIRPLKIVIDPGHGGWDTGTVGPTGLQEKELVLDVAERLSRLLKARLGAETILTRGDDTFVPLALRPALANSVGADLFVSIHGNSSSAKSVRGVETFYVAPAAYKGAASGSPPLGVTASRRFAAVVQHALYATLSGADPLVQDRGVKAAPLSVLVAPTMPSLLTEISFVSSSYDEQKLRRPEYRDTIAEALFQGIKTYAARTGRDDRQRASAAGFPGK